MEKSPQNSEEKGENLQAEIEEGESKDVLGSEKQEDKKDSQENEKSKPEKADSPKTPVKPEESTKRKVQEVKLEKPKAAPQQQKAVTPELQTQLEALLDSTKQNRVYELERFGKEHGFFNFALRSRAYIMLLGIAESDLEINQLGLTVDLGFETNDVIANDAIRSFIGYKEVENYSSFDLEAKRKDLSQILHFFFKRHRQMSYYQGLNTFAELFLLVFGKNLAYLYLEKYCLKYLRKYLTNEGFEAEIKNQIYVTLKILEKELPDYQAIFKIGDNGERASEKLGFIISWIVTWFAYKMKDLEAIFANFDFLMVQPPHTVSLLVGLVIRELVKLHSLSADSEDEQIFLTFYSSSLDGLNWARLRQECVFLDQTERYDLLDSSKARGPLALILSRLRAQAADSFPGGPSLSSSLGGRLKQGLKGGAKMLGNSLSLGKSLFGALKSASQPK